MIDDLSSGKRENLNEAIAAGARLETGDVTDGSRLLTTIQGSSPRPSSTSPPRSTCGSRWPTRPSTRA